MVESSSPESLPEPQAIVSTLSSPLETTTTQVALLQSLASWLRAADVSEMDRASFLEEVSLDLPSSLIRYACSNETPSNSSCGQPSVSECAQYCLEQLAREGNPKEVFMALTNAVLQFPQGLVSAEGEAESEEGHRQDEPEREWPPADHRLVEVLLPPLAKVLYKILTKSRNPSAFFTPFSQSLITILACPRLIPHPHATDIYIQLLHACHMALALHPTLELPVAILAFSSACLLFGDRQGGLNLTIAYLCEQSPKWRSTFARLAREEARTNDPTNSPASHEPDARTRIQESIKPILAALVPSDAQRAIKPLPWLDVFGSPSNSLDSEQAPFTLQDVRAACAQISHGSVDLDCLLHLTRSGGLVVHAMDQFMQTDRSPIDPRSPTTSTSLLLDILRDPSQRALDASLFLVLSDPPSEAAEELGAVLAVLAANTADKAARLVIFRTLVSLIDRLDEHTRSRLLGRLLSPSFQLNIQAAIVNLLKEKTAEFGIGYWTQPMMETLQVEIIDGREELTPEVVSNGGLKLAIEKLNLVYLLLRKDQSNATGLKTGKVNWRLKECLVSPLHHWIQENLEQDGDAVSASMALELVISALE